MGGIVVSMLSVGRDATDNGFHCLLYGMPLHAIMCYSAYPALSIGFPAGFALYGPYVVRTETAQQIHV